MDDDVPMHEYRLDPVAKDDESRALALTSSVLGIQFPQDYTDRGVMYLLKHSCQTALGGAIIVHDPPFRSLQGMPAPSRDLSDQTLEQESTAEINGVWLASHHRSPYMSFTFWSLILQELLNCGAQQFLFTFDNSNNRMRDLVQWANPQVLYSGTTLQLPGMKSPSVETIVLVDRKRVSSFHMLIKNSGRIQKGSVEHGLADQLKIRSKRKAA